MGIARRIEQDAQGGRRRPDLRVVRRRQPRSGLRARHRHAGGRRLHARARRWSSSAAAPGSISSAATWSRWRRNTTRPPTPPRPARRCCSRSCALVALARRSPRIGENLPSPAAADTGSGGRLWAAWRAGRAAARGPCARRPRRAGLAFSRPAKPGRVRTDHGQQPLQLALADAELGQVPQRADQIVEVGAGAALRARGSGAPARRAAAGRRSSGAPARRCR